ncbi:MAG: transposase family protein, partial [Spirochaetaceae bacterium]|nr:transposase family protein [Spirochaetaceae bacterium]
MRHFDGAGVYSGWTEEVSLRNRARRRGKDAVAALKTTLPFPMLGIDSDNGGEFINKQLIDWCAGNRVQFTRGRPYR